MLDIIKSIYRHPLISEKDLEKISERHRPVEFQKNEFLLKEGETADGYYILTEGLVRAFVHDYDNNDITTEFFVKHEIVIVPSSLFQQLFLIKTNRELSLLTKSAEERYLDLFRFSPHLIQEIPLKYLSSFIGITPQALSRIRRRIF